MWTQGIDAQMTRRIRPRTTYGVSRWLWLGSCVIAVGCNSGSSQPAPAGGGRGGRGGPGAGGPTPVEVSIAELGRAARSVTATGTVEPVRTVGINAQVSGALLRVTVEEGNVVSAGTVLAQIDSRELEAQLASAAANLEVAKRAAERSQELRKQQ